MIDLAKRGIRALSRSWINFLYPFVCHHCGEVFDTNDSCLCKGCLELLELIDPLERCPHCFSALYSKETKVCGECHRKPSALYRTIAAFEYLGPAASLLLRLKYGNQPYLAKALSPYIAAQMLRTDWPLPDCVVPVPISFTRLFERGYNQCQLLAEGIGHLIKRPVIDALTRKSGDYSQAGLSRTKRIEFQGNTLSLKKRIEVQDQVVLLVDDVITTGSTMRRCAEALLEGYPKVIYGIAVCRA